MARSRAATAIDDDLKAIEEDAKKRAEAKAGEPKYEATDPARKYAADFGIDLSDVRGTGADGRILVMDVEKVKKEMDTAEAKAQAEADAPAEKPPPEKEVATPKVKVHSKAREIVSDPRRGVFTRTVMPTLKPGIERVWHIHRALAEFGMGWDQLVVSAEQANEGIGRYLAEGWVLMHIQQLRVDSDGVHMLWVLGYPEESYAEEWPYREVHHLVRRIGAFGDDGRGITHVAANRLVEARLTEGWDLAYVRSIGISVQDGGLMMLWVFLR